jgi:uncharacterized membrane protein
MANDEIYLGSPDNPKTAAVVAYITLIGWLIAYFVLYKYNKTKNSVATFHIRQSLLLHILAFILNILSLFALWRWIPYAIVVVLAVLLFILWLIGAFAAINGEEKPVPLVGKWAQSMFSNL